MQNLQINEIKADDQGITASCQNSKQLRPATNRDFIILPILSLNYKKMKYNNYEEIFAVKLPSGFTHLLIY